MKIIDRVRSGYNEGPKWEYKRKRAEAGDIVKDLVALANASGGTLVYPIAENDGEIIEIQSVGNFSKLEESINQIISRSVEPSIEVRFVSHDIDGKTIVSMDVSDSNQLHSYEHNSRPVFPTRQGSTTDYLTGHEIREVYLRRSGGVSEVGKPSEQESENSQKGLPTTELEIPSKPQAHFTQIPDGHISRVCTFAPVHWPNNPVRATAVLQRISIKELEEIINSLTNYFSLDSFYNSFTLHQQGGAWFGKGIGNFLSAVKNRDSLYSTLPEGSKFDPYKSYQGLYIGNSSFPYKDTTVVIHAEPLATTEGCRKFSINFVFDGHPTDTSFLSSFGEDTNMIIGNAETVEENTTGFPEPAKIPVDTIQLIESDSTPIDEGTTYASGAVCQNPFFQNNEILANVLDMPQRSGPAEYERIPARLRDHHPVNEEREYETIRYIVTEMDSLTSRIPLSVYNVQYEINW